MLPARPLRKIRPAAIAQRRVALKLVAEPRALPVLTSIEEQLDDEEEGTFLAPSLSASLARTMMSTEADDAPDSAPPPPRSEIRGLTRLAREDLSDGAPFLLESDVEDIEEDEDATSVFRPLREAHDQLDMLLEVMNALTAPPPGPPSAVVVAAPVVVAPLAVGHEQPSAAKPPPQLEAPLLPRRSWGLAAVIVVGATVFAAGIATVYLDSLLALLS